MSDRDEIVRVDVELLKLWPGNPRRGNREAIRESIRVNGLYKPLLVQRGTDQVLVGNNTLAEARELGIRQVDVIYKDVDDETGRRIMLADNRTSDVSGYDDEALYTALLTMDDLAGTGWSLEDAEALLRMSGESDGGNAELEFPMHGDGDGVLVLDDVRTGADWAELPQQTEARAERQAAQTVSSVKGVREIMLVYSVDEHREMILLLDGLKKSVGGDVRYPQIVQSLVRQAARAAGLV